MEKSWTNSLCMFHVKDNDAEPLPLSLQNVFIVDFNFFLQFLYSIFTLSTDL